MHDDRWHTILFSICQLVFGEAQQSQRPNLMPAGSSYPCPLPPLACSLPGITKNHFHAHANAQSNFYCQLSSDPHLTTYQPKGYPPPRPTLSPTLPKISTRCRAKRRFEFAFFAKTRRKETPKRQREREGSRSSLLLARLRFRFRYTCPSPP